MEVSAFIAEMNALQGEFDTLPAEVAKLIASLMELTEVQQGSIDALLAANKVLLGVIDRLKG